MIVVPIQQVRVSAHVISIPNPTLHYQLNEASGNAIEVVSGLDMTQHNSPGAVTGIVNGARSFNGSNQYFDHAVDAAFALDTTETIAFWVYLNSLASTQICVERAVPAGNVDWHIFYVTGLNVFRIGIRTSGSTLTFFDSPSGPTVSTWHAVAVKWDGSNLYWSIDGAAWTGSAFTSTPLTSGTARAYMGTLQAAANWLNGYLDAVTFWKGTALTSAEIADFSYGGVGHEFNGTIWV